MSFKLLILGLAYREARRRNATKLFPERKRAEDGAGGLSTYDGGYYCGPGWGFTREDVESGKLAELPEAIDAIDRACKAHDQCYLDDGYFSQSCDRLLIGDLKTVVADPKASDQQRRDAAIMAAYFYIQINTIEKARRARENAAEQARRIQRTIDVHWHGMMTMKHTIDLILLQERSAI